VRRLHQATLCLVVPHCCDACFTPPRLVKFLQGRTRAHQAVSLARTRMLALWCERHLPALLLHVRIVSAGRGLDLKNLTTNDREHIRQAQQQFQQEYRYTAPQAGADAASPPHSEQPAPSGPGAVASEPPPPCTIVKTSSRRGSCLEAPAAPGKARSPAALAQYRRMDSSLLRAMNSAAFHGFLRAHLDLIHSSEFQAYNAPLSAASSSLGAGTYQQQHQQYLHSKQYAAARSVALHAKLLEMVFRKRREFLLRTGQRTEVVYARFSVTVEEAQRFVRGGEDPLRLHLIEQRRLEQVHAEVRQNRKHGSRRRAVTKRQSQRQSPERAPSNAPAGSDGALTSRSEGPPPFLKGASSKGNPFSPGSLSRGNSFKGPPQSSPTILSKGNSFKGPPQSSPTILSKGNSFKHSAVKSSSKPPAAPSRDAAPATEDDEESLQLPPPEVLLLLRAVKAEEVALAYFDVSDRLRRATATAARDSARRRQSSADHAHRPSVAHRTLSVSAYSGGGVCAPVLEEGAVHEATSADPAAGPPGVIHNRSHIGSGLHPRRQSHVNAGHVHSHMQPHVPFSTQPNARGPLGKRTSIVG
jgi:hypothetical protein